ncbi:MAG: hypothetical protein AAB417_01965 [Patescibacteria group bacterium]
MNSYAIWALVAFATALVLKVAGVAGFWATLIIIGMFAAGRIASQANERIGKIVMWIAAVLAVVTILLPFAVRVTVGGFPSYIGGSFERRGASVALRTAERIDDGTYDIETRYLQGCKDEIDRETTRLTGEMNILTAARIAGKMDVGQFDREFNALGGQIDALRVRREECSVKFRGRDLSEIVAKSAIVTNATAKVKSGWNAFPDFERRSGFILLIGIMYILIGLIVRRFHAQFGGAIFAPGVLLVLLAVIDSFAGAKSWPAQVIDVLTGDYSGQPLLVTALKATAVGIIALAALGFKPSVRLGTVVTAVFIWLLAALAQPGASFGSIADQLSGKFGGVNITAPINKIFGGTQTVPCRDHDALFRDADIGQLVRCFQRMETGDKTMLQLHGGDWGITPSNAPMHITLWYGEEVVYRGVYRPGTHPTANRIQITANGPADLTISMRKLDSAAQTRR